MKACAPFLTYPDLFIVGERAGIYTRAEPLIPDHIEEIVSPFLGGGEFELRLAAKGIKIKGYDLFPHLINLWEYMLTDAKSLTQKVLNLYDDGKGDRAYFQDRLAERWLSTDSEYRAALTLAINHLSLKGGSFRNKKRDSRISKYVIIDKVLYNVQSNGQMIVNQDYRELEQWQASNIEVADSHFRSTFMRHKDSYLYLDPPVRNQKKGRVGDSKKYSEDFEHDILTEHLRNRDNWMMITANAGNILDDYSHCDIDRHPNTSMSAFYDHLIITPRAKNGDISNE